MNILMINVNDDNAKVTPKSAAIVVKSSFMSSSHLEAWASFNSDCSQEIVDP